MGITEEILAETRRYVVGPHEEDELLPDRPEEFYVSGLLFPAETRLEAEDSETLAPGKHPTRTPLRTIANTHVDGTFQTRLG